MPTPFLCKRLQETGIDFDFWRNGDFNGDGGVDSADLNVIGLNWQTGVPAAVPEPATSAFCYLILAVFVALFWRHAE